MTAIDINEFIGIAPLELKLPRIDRDAARHRSALSRLRIEGEVELQGQRFGFANRPILEDRTGKVSLIELLIDGVSVTVAVTFDPWRLFGSGSTAPLSPEALALALEHLLTGELEALEGARGVSVEVVSVTQEASIRTATSILKLEILSEGAAGFDLYMWSEEPGLLADLLSQGWARHAPRALPQMTFDVAFIGPMAVLPRRRVQRLAMGDVLKVSEGWTDLSQHLSLLVRGEHILPLKHGETGFVSTGTELSLAALRNQFNDGVPMTQAKQSALGSLKDPKTVITLELDRAQMSLSELQDIQNGDVLDFGTTSVETVRVHADGAPIAEGRLVQMDATYGVQVTKLL